MRPLALNRRNNQATGKREETPLDKALRTARSTLGVMLVFSFFVNVLRLTIPIFMLNVIERVIPSRSEATLFYLFMMAAVALAVGAALSGVVQVLQSKVARWLETSLFTPVLGSALDGQLVGLPSSQGSMRDLGQIRQFIGGGALTTLLDAPWFPIFLLVIFLMHPWLGLVTLVAAVILLAIAWLGDFLTRDLLLASSQQTQRVQKEVFDGLRNSAVVHAMAIMPAFLGRTDKMAEAARHDQGVLQQRNAFISSIARFVRQLAQISMLGVGAYLVLENQITSGGMIVGMILLSTALQPVQGSVQSWRAMVQAWTARKRLGHLLETAPQRSGDTEVANPEGHLNLRQAMFMPPGRGRPIIRPMSFDVMPGETLGILGPSGAGKSTLCKLLVGVHPPSQGTIHFDGLDLHRQLGANIGSHIGYLPQDPMLFSATIAENICRFTDDGKGDLPAETTDAAQLANIHEVILDLPQRYQTAIDDQTTDLSRSEKQRIALARAFFGRPRLIVLDEPFTFLDRASEERLLRALKELRAQGSTIVLVSQNVRFLNACDKLLFIRSGMVEAFGKPERVLSVVRQGGNQVRRQRLRAITADSDLEVSEEEEVVEPAFATKGQG